MGSPPGLKPTLTLLLSIISSISHLVQAQGSDSTYPKRGLIYIDGRSEDYDVFTSEQSPLTWYYSYSPWPTLLSWKANFAPMIHGVRDAPEAVRRIQAFVNGSQRLGANTLTHVLSFNEPDGDRASGGSDSSPEHSAEVYLEYIAPLREAPYNLKVSVPATTGSPMGLEWLRGFNESCWDQNPDKGCEFDFVATHWYGDFAGMASWLGTVHELYPDLPIWLTEFAIPQLDDDETREFMNQSLPYLDDLDYVERYSWFGTFRTNDANEWTGDGVSMLNGRGGLSDLGAEYMGGDQQGFEAGQRGQGGGASSSRCSIFFLIACLMVGLSSTVY
ncbi:hypothetical protein PV10_06538 [Exophiala mesophila]|uniref:Asl1-like glycosyl hydrolase catalytic domain-containing protein n=1 Tax=Exophiala mesophila TaxID=212818 RepID=A0A0D1ZBK5_EXOME|nr:uncharacterized protein PV10_06538 [Exophiala mesophila]KIV92067.1 hypothetical protein PV10_06538 [Exophiala mesophila]